MTDKRWPQLRVEDWSDTEDTLQLWLQIVGKIGDEGAFYSYAYPEPDGYADYRVGPSDAYYSKEVGEFLLTYEAVRTSASPDAALLEFLHSTYQAAADCGRWDRDALEVDPTRWDHKNPG